MLNQLSVSNFAIAKNLNLIIKPGMTVITGETGAGKSIILDALALALGDRTDAGVVRHGEQKADISAAFDLSTLPGAKHWLTENDLDEGDECILRRVITAEGRSRGYINGRPAPMQQLRQLGEMLIDIHSQHEHQSLLRKDKHQAFLDAFAQCEALTEAVATAFRQWQKSQSKLEELQSSSEERDARQQLISFQVQELDNLSLREGEIEALESEQSLLANAGEVIHTGHQVISLCSEQEASIADQLSAAMHQLGQLSQNSAIEEAASLLEEARIQVEEASTTLRNFVDNLDTDPARLQEVEDRLSTAYQLARKHRVNPEDLPALLEKLAQELSAYENGEESIDVLTQQTARLAETYQTQAESLSTKRRAAAERLNQAITAQLKTLHMPSVTFCTELTPTTKFSVHGLETTEFLVSMNPGQPAKPLVKVASGGELSRISLAIQVILAQSTVIPTLVFDEVDVGIGGGTAEVVGRLLQGLGRQGQILCVTHLPQVASCGHHHLHVSKTIQEGQTESSIVYLESNHRTEEVARMLGGMDITETTRKHAEEMLTTASTEG